MKALKNHTISELISHLLTLGVEWTGDTTRKAPLIELIEKLEALPIVRSESDLPSTMRFESAPVMSYSWEQLVLIWQHFKRGNLTSEEINDMDTLWVKIKALLCSLPGRKPQVTLAKVVAGATMSRLSQKPTAELRGYCKVRGLDANVTDNDQADKCNMLYYLKHHIAAYNRDFTRNLTLDLENCHKAYDTSSMSLKVLPSNISEYPREHIRPNGTFLHHVVKNMMTRGFHEPDISFNSPPAALYFCCDLADRPFTVGCTVRLKSHVAPVEALGYGKGIHLTANHYYPSKVLAINEGYEGTLLMVQSQIGNTFVTFESLASNFRHI